jgi:Histidine kinase-like ATPase domain
MTAASGSREHGTGSSAGAAASMSAMRWRRVFPGEERQLNVLRRWLESLLPDCAARGDVASVATELGTNAIRHTASGQGAWFAVEITWHQLAVRVAVADCGSPAEPRVIDDPGGEHGRGLLLVQGMSVRTGVCGDHRGRLVWADIPWGDTGAAASASAQDRYEAAIGDDQAGLATRFTGVPAWFGRCTLQWWALADGELVTAPSAQELAGVLGRVLASAPPRARAAGGMASVDARTTPAISREQRPSESPPRFSPARALVPQSERDGVGLGGHRGLRTSSQRHRPGATPRQANTASGPGRSAAAAS